MNLAIRIAAVFFIMAGFLLTGCQTAKETPMPAEIPAKIPTATTATLPSVATSAPTQVALPAEWNGIPVFPDALTAEEDMGDLRMTTAALPLRIVAFYKQKMPDLGWALEESMTSGSDLVFVKDGIYAFFRVVQGDRNNEVDIHLVKQE
jgi:hypothetical protein